MALPILKSDALAAAGSDDPLEQFEAESPVSRHGGRSVAAAPSAPRPSVTSPLATSPSAAGPSAAGPLAARPPAPQFDASPNAFDGSEPVALETVVSAAIAVSWLEAVAILEATCGALVSADGEELPAPNPSDIFLTAQGGIEVRTRFGFGRGESVQRLARTLHTLTSGQAIPAPLRLFTSKWIASEGDPAIADFAKELAYFARPNGSDLIRDVYERCATAPVTKKQTRGASKQQPENEAEKKSPKFSPKPATRSRAALAIAVVSLLMAVAILLAFSRGPQTGQAGSSGLLANLAAGAADFARSLGEVRTQLGNLSTQLSAHLALGRDEAAPAKPAPVTQAPATSNRANTNTRTSTSQTASVPLPVRTLPGLATGSASPARSAASAPALDLSALRPPDAGRPESPTAAQILAPVETIDPDTIYTSADDGISPPKMLYPQLPPPPLVISQSNNNVNVMEIVINDDGSVERVHLVSQPRRLTDMMLLSGAKSWKFEPASKNGLPVRYRMAFSWATTP